ncbi:MAG: heavy-metal-associated domain-containing protein [Clostridia bacterium]|nr:heavy-metal-associated domain-containing protein [Clostridia bacterium]
MEKKILVEGMMCNHCKASVEKVLGAVPGVSQVVVDLEARTATVQCDSTVTDEALFAAIEKKGFKPLQVL